MKAESPSRLRVVEQLRQVEPQIRGFGVRRLALFGSVARDEARPDSDVDVLVEFVPGQKSFDRFMALTDFLEDLLGYPVETFTTEALSPYIGPQFCRRPRMSFEPLEYLQHILVEAEYLAE